MKFLVVVSALVAAACAEAEADPAVLYGAYGYGGYGYGGLYGYSGLKSAPCVNAANVPVPCNVGAGYAHVGYPYAHLGKREAEAEPEADPAVLYGGYAAYPYTHYGAYAGIPNPVHAVAATPFGLTHSSNVGLCTNYLGAAVPCGRKKREAEAEADPALLYGAYAAYPYAHYGAYAGYPYALSHGVAATNNVLGHAVAYNALGLGAVHSSHVGVCTNYLGAQVPC